MRCSTQGQGQGQVVREGFPVTPSSKLKIRKGLWSPEEDEKLVAYIINNGMLGCSWAYVAKQAGLQRCGKSCRLRWINYLRPGLKRGAFSRQEERLIIKLQSILGNRWSQIAAHMPGRTDNEIKNYWNSSIKKTLKLKPHLFSTTNCSTNGNSNIPSPSDGTCNTNLGFHHAHDAGKLGHSARPYLDARPEGYKTPNNNGLNVVTAGENQVCVPGVLESNQEQVQYQKEEINQLISNFEMWINNDTCTQTHEIVSSHAAFLSPNLQAQGLHSYNTAESSTCDELIIESCRTTVAAHEAPASANYSLGSTVPATVGSECLKEKIENDGWSTSRSYRNTDNWSHVLDPGAYTSHEAGISIVEDCRRLDEKSTHQSWHSLSFRSEFGAPAIKQAVGQSNDFQAQDDCRDHLNLRYDVNLGIPKYMDIYSRRNSYQLPQIEGGGGVSDQWDFSAIPQEEMNSNPVLTILGGGSRQSEIECQGGTGQVTVWAHDDI